MKENLQKIIDRIHGALKDTKVEMVFIKSVDLRKFALKTIDKNDAVLDKFAKTQGLYQQDRPNDLETGYKLLKISLERLAATNNTSVQEELDRLLKNKGLAPVILA